MSTTNTEPRSIVSVQLRRHDIERLRALAQASERSLSGELRVAVAEHIEAAESKEAT
jgi:hypothetical protein